MPDAVFHFIVLVPHKDAVFFDDCIQYGGTKLRGTSKNSCAAILHGLCPHFITQKPRHKPIRLKFLGFKLRTNPAQPCVPLVFRDALIKIPFPHIAPIAITKVPVQMPALKSLAKKLRLITLRSEDQGERGKINCGAVITEKLFGAYNTNTDNYFIIGRKLLLDAEELLDNFDNIENIKYKFENIVLTAFLTNTASEGLPMQLLEKKLPSCGIGSCALANMAVRLIGSSSFEWAIGRLFWLQKYRAGE